MQIRALAVFFEGLRFVCADEAKKRATRAGQIHFDTFGEARFQRMRLSNDQQVPEWSGPR